MEKKGLKVTLSEFQNTGPSQFYCFCYTNGHSGPKGEIVRMEFRYEEPQLTLFFGDAACSRLHSAEGKYEFVSGNEAIQDKKSFDQRFSQVNPADLEAILDLKNLSQEFKIAVIALLNQWA